MSVKDRPHVPHGMAGDGGDFDLGTARDGESSDRRPAKIVEGHANNTGFLASISPRTAKAILGPRLIVRA